MFKEHLMTEKYSPPKLGSNLTPLTFWAGTPTARPQKATSQSLITYPSDSRVNCTTAIYILGETHQLIPYSATSHLGDPQHSIQYSEDLHKATFLIVLKMIICNENKFSAHWGTILFSHKMFKGET